MKSRADELSVPGLDADSLLRALVAVSADGLAVLDWHGRFAVVNAAAVEVLGLPADDLIGHPAPFPLDDADLAGLRDCRRRAAWLTPDGRRRDLEYRLVPLAGGAYAVWFSDVTDVLRQQERLTAITRAASSVADAGSLRATLDAVANEIVMTTNIAAVQILAIDDPRDELRVLGMAGFGDAADFIERLSACRRLGAHVRFMDAIQNREPVVVLNRKPSILVDPRWAPLHAIMDHPDWDSFVSMPVMVRGRAIGTINAYYVPGEDPGPSSLAFLEAMADHAAIAIDIAAHLARTRSQAQSDERRRLARDLHDSVVQQLFSMRMQAEALRSQVDSADPDPARMRGRAHELAELSQSALADLRGLVFELHPLELAERGLVDAVRAHAASLEARGALAIDVQAPADLEFDLAIEIQEDLYRIVQEALHNVVKHARAHAVNVRVALVDGALTIDVTDDGCGLDPGAERAPRTTLGLVSMRERAERWGGQLFAGPHPAGGWTVQVTMPGAARPAPRTEEATNR
ncbi:GAF domain-containing sensor histidine kinase [Planosporangium flavigriseum]|uniref:sensor histidine kinase n=1 Tax=Planosporangium flavigriseum TaxID=373681 RepID=UPI00143CA7FE|nr:GAF domain-containing sensor histidine kinase [Planosporangium flavigriseum]NJC66605.1 GAF domain-containing sensor histidine kinase [Planosporangium flavigriseum]